MATTPNGLKGKVCAVTGATGGLGKALSLEFARRGARVVMICRDHDKGSTAAAEVRSQTGNNAVELRLCDLSSLESVRTCAEEFHSLHSTLDVLAHTAAVYTKDRRVSPDGFELMFATNHLGPFLLTNLLMSSLKAAASARVITVSAPSSTELNFDDLQGVREFGSYHAFGASKSANLLFAFAAARRLAGTHVTSNAVHPGLMKTNLMHDAPAVLRVILNLVSRPPRIAAVRVGELAASPNFEGVTGTFFKGTKAAAAPAYSQHSETQERLWKVSAELAGFAA